VAAIAVATASPAFVLSLLAEFNASATNLVVPVVASVSFETAAVA
jgi:hypothetical protein